MFKYAHYEIDLFLGKSIYYMPKDRNAFGLLSVKSLFRINLRYCPKEPGNKSQEIRDKNQDKWWAVKIIVGEPVLFRSDIRRPFFVYNSVSWFLSLDSIL